MIVGVMMSAHTKKAAPSDTMMRMYITTPSPQSLSFHHERSVIFHRFPSESRDTFFSPNLIAVLIIRCTAPRILIIWHQFASESRYNLFEWYETYRE